MLRLKVCIRSVLLSQADAAQQCTAEQIICSVHVVRMRAMLLLLVQAEVLRMSVPCRRLVQ